MGVIRKDRSDLADVITSLTWGDLQKIGKELTQMIKDAADDDIPYNVDGEGGFASVLWNWAEGEIDANASD